MLVLGALIAIGPLTIDMYLPALPGLANDFGASDAAVQATLTGTLAGIALGQLVVGPLSDAFGRRRPLLVGIVAHAVTSLLCAVAPTLPLLVTARVLQGLAGAAVSVVVLAVVRDLFSGAEVATLLSRLMLVLGVAPVAAPSLGGALLTFTSWRGIFVVLAVAGALLTVLAALQLDETLEPARRRSARPVATLRAYGVLLRDVPFVALAVVSGLVFGTLFAYVSGSPFVLQGLYGLDQQAFSLVFGANAVGLVLATQANPILLRRWTPRAVLIAAVAASAVASAVLMVTALTGFGGLLGVLVPLWVAVAMCGLSFPNTPALALDRHGERAGTAAAVLGAAQFGIGGLAAPLVGVVGTATAVPMALIMLSATTAALALLVTVVSREAGPAPAPSRAVHAG